MVALEAHYELLTKPAKKDTTTIFGLTTKQSEIFTHNATSSNNTGSAKKVQNQHRFGSIEKKGTEFQMLNSRSIPQDYTIGI